MNLCSFVIPSNFSVEYHPGDIARNAIWIFQWSLNGTFYALFLGGTGNHEEGKLLEKLVNNSGVETRRTPYR